jgi:hypothetical protein
MLRQLQRAVDTYNEYQLITLIVLIIAAIAYFFFVHLPNKEHFQDPNQPPVPLEQALPKIKENLNEELELINKMTGYYENFTKIAASSKAEKPTDLPKAQKQVEQEMQKEMPGKIIMLPYVKAIQDYLKTLTSAPEINRLYIAYILLPKNIDMYISTGEYLDIKGKQLYDYVATLGKNTPSGGTKKEQKERKEMGKKTEKVKGSTGDTFGTQNALSGPPPPPYVKEAFANPEMPDCCTKNKVEALKLTPEQISALYYISETRARKIGDSSIKTTLEKLAITYKKLNDLQSQVEEGGGDVYGKIAGGQSPETALTSGFVNYITPNNRLARPLNGFTDFGPNYAYLIYNDTR